MKLSFKQVFLFFLISIPFNLLGVFLESNTLIYLGLFIFFGSLLLVIIKIKNLKGEKNEKVIDTPKKTLTFEQKLEFIKSLSFLTWISVTLYLIFGVDRIEDHIFLSFVSTISFITYGIFILGSVSDSQFKFGSGLCPNCLKKISRLSSKCPYCHSTF